MDAWHMPRPTVVAAPYVVMELVEGEAMHVAMDREWHMPQSRTGLAIDQNGFVSKHWENKQIG